VHLVGFIIRVYHGSPERQRSCEEFNFYFSCLVWFWVLCVVNYKTYVTMTNKGLFIKRRWLIASEIICELNSKLIIMWRFVF